MRICFGFALVATALIAARGQTSKSAPSSPQTIVFVCEHGAAKSVIAAAYFNKLAAERHLNFHAIARGTDPQAELSESTIAGLQRDGIAFPNQKPLPLTDRDVRKASHVVAFCVVPSRFRKKVGAKSYDVPAPKVGYDKSRDAILVHVRQLLDELEASSKRP